MNLDLDTLLKELAASEGIPREEEEGNDHCLEHPVSVLYQVLQEPDPSWFVSCGPSLIGPLLMVTEAGAYDNPSQGKRLGPRRYISSFAQAIGRECNAREVSLICSEVWISFRQRIETLMDDEEEEEEEEKEEERRAPSLPKKSQLSGYVASWMMMTQVILSSHARLAPTTREKFLVDSIWTSFKVMVAITWAMIARKTHDDQERKGEDEEGMDLAITWVTSTLDLLEGFIQIERPFGSDSPSSSILFIFLQGCSYACMALGLTPHFTDAFFRRYIPRYIPVRGGDRNVSTDDRVASLHERLMVSEEASKMRWVHRFPIRETHLLEVTESGFLSANPIGAASFSRFLGAFSRF